MMQALGRWWRARRFLRAVHYFGRAHAVNFWDAADLSEAPGHLARIRADGFNAVVVVVPWRGFQRSMTPPAYDEENLARLRRLLMAIQSARLKCVLRVSYPFNHDPDSEGDYDERSLWLFTRAEVRAAWLDYLRRLRAIAEAFPAFEFAFFSWEDVPAIRELMPHRSPHERRVLAEATGYREFLADRFSLDRVSQLYGERFSDWAQVYIPLADSAGYRLFHEFVNTALDRLLADGRRVWPRLALQVRVDHDRARVDGEDVWLENDMRIDDRGMRVTYYGLPMYTEAGTKSLSAEGAQENLERMLRRVTADGRNTNHFLDQFLFHEESPLYQFPTMAVPAMRSFLAAAAVLLQRYSRGYAFWSYYDYRVNHFYNPAFVRGLHGWRAQGDVSLQPRGAKTVAVLAPGAAIEQRMDPHTVGHAPWLYEELRFSATAGAMGGKGRIAVVTQGIVEAELEIASGPLQAVEASLPPERHSGGKIDVALRNTGDVPIAVTELCMWGFVYRAHIYDEDGRPGRYHGAVTGMLRTRA